MKTIKKLVSFLLVICMAVSAVPVFAHGPEQEVSVAAQSEEIVYYTDPQSAAAVLREGMKNRESTVTIGYQLNTADKDNIKSIANEIEEKATAHTGVANEGDYLKWHLSEITWKASGYIKGQTAYYTVVYTMDYNTTKAQEAAVDKAVNAPLNSLNLQGKSDYEKISAVYEWMCSNIKYDYTHLKDNAYRQQYTAYGALINKTSVCEGYGLLFYRLMLELGIDCRFISGNRQTHAWNIVKLDGKYYNVDATWDATYYQAYGKYNYFLRCDKNFADHTRDNEYATNAFYAAYPMSASDYKAQQSHTQQTKLDNVTITNINAHTTGNILYWGAVDGADLYQVFRLNGGSWELLTNTRGLAYKDTTAQVGVKHYYKIVARNGDVKSDIKTTASASATRPAAITKLDNVTITSINAHTSGNIIYWNAVDNATLYQVYRLNGSSWELLKNTGSTAYKDESAPAGVKCYYKIIARNGSLSSSIATTASASATRPAAITKLDNVTITKTVGHKTGNILYWNAVDNATLYQVYRLNGSKWELLQSTGNTTYKDETAPVGCNSYYKIVVRNGNIKSDIASTASTQVRRP